MTVSRTGTFVVVALVLTMAQAGAPDVLRAQASPSRAANVQDASRSLVAQGAAPAAAQATTPASQAPATSPPVAWSRISYLSGPSVYVDAGTKDGLREGSRLEVVRSGATIADLVVAFVSSSRASCTVARGDAALAIGDSVRFAAPPAAANMMASASGAGGTPGAAAAGAASSSARSSTVRSAPSPIRGRIGIRYLLVDPGLAGAGFTVPAFDIRLDGQRIGGSPFGISVDVRAQGARSGGASSSVSGGGVTRVYQAALAWNPLGSSARVTVGRQFATALSTIGIFDGGALDYDRRRWSVGAFSGTQPDPLTFGYSTSIREYGTYLQLHNPPGQAPLWSFTVGGIGSYDRGQIDREFLYLQAMFTSGRFSLYSAQELDYNRGWKATTEKGAITPTSSFATVRFSLTDAFSLDGGVDNRRSVRLYRDYVNPEIAFDDSFREGVWGGASLSLFNHLRISSDARTSGGGPAGAAQSLTTSVGVSRLTPLQVGLHARMTTYTGQIASGRLQSASVEINPFGSLRLEFSGGTRESKQVSDGSVTTPLTWYGVDADVGIGRSVYLMLSTYRETGSTNKAVQSYGALSYRF